MPFPLDAFRLDGRVALITGGSGGLGAVFARALAGVGANVALLARRINAVRQTASAVSAETGCRTLADVSLTGSVLTIDGGWTAQSGERRKMKDER